MGRRRQEHDFTVKDGGVYTKVGKKDELVGDVDVTGRYRVKLGGQVSPARSPTTASRPTTSRSSAADAKKATDQLQIGHDPVPEGILVLPEGKFTVKDGQMSPSGGKHAQGSVTVIRRGAGLDQLTLSARYYWRATSPATGLVEHETDLASTCRRRAACCGSARRGAGSSRTAASGST